MIRKANEILSNAGHKAMREIILLILVIVVAIVSFCFDLFKPPLPSWALIQVKDLESFMGVLFTVQVSMLSMIIAIVALLANRIEKRSYGVSVTKYVMHYRQLIFKHTTIIFMSLVIISLTYIAIVKHYYNFSVFLFFFSILLIFLMLKDAVQSVAFTNELDDEIKTFIVKQQRGQAELIDAFKSELIESAETNNYSLAKKDCDFLVFLFQQLHGTKELLNALEAIFCEYVRAAYTSKSENLYALSIDTMLDIYRFANNLPKNIIALTIWDMADYDILRMLPSLGYYKLKENDYLSYIHSFLYENLALEKSNEQNTRTNSHSLAFFSSNVYRILFVRNNCNFVDAEQKKIKRILFNNINSLIDGVSHFLLYNLDKIETAETTKSKLQLQTAKKELQLYLKILIDQNDIETFEEFLNDSFSAYQKNERTDLILIIIYLYYLAYEENRIANKSDIQESARALLHKDCKFFMSIMDYYFSSSSNGHRISIDTYKADLRSWEITPERVAYRPVMSSVVDKFFIYSLVFLQVDFWPNLQAIIDNDNIFSYYNRFYNSVADYCTFIKNIYDASCEAEGEAAKYKNFQAALVTIYKNHEIKKGKNEVLTAPQITSFESNVKQIAQEELEKVFCHFEEPVDDYKTATITMGVFNLLTLFMDKYFDEDFFRRSLYKCSISALLDLLKDHMNLKEIKVGDEHKLDSFFTLFDPAAVDMVIGNGEEYYGDAAMANYHAFLDNKIHLPEADDFMCLYALQTSLANISIERIHIELRDYTFEEILQGRATDDDGNFLYNVTNDIYLPFLKEELIPHIKNTRKRLTISIDVNYKFKSDKIGGGLVLALDD